MIKTPTERAFSVSSTAAVVSTLQYGLASPAPGKRAANVIPGALENTYLDPFDRKSPARLNDDVPCPAMAFSYAA